MVRNIIMIHGYNGIPKIYEWLKEELEQMGYSVILPQLPIKENVIYEKWRKILDDYKNEINSETIVIAHSIGNEFIIRYVVENNIKIKEYIGLAGFAEYFENKGNEDLNRAIKEFLVTKKEIDNFKNLVDKKWCIYSNNDHIVPFDILEKYPKTIESEFIFIKGIGHMGKKSGLETIPEVLEIINSH